VNGFFGMDITMDIAWIFQPRVLEISFNTLAATCTHMAARFGKSASRRVPIWRLFKCVQSVCDEYSTVMWAAYPLPWRDAIPVRPPERACPTIPRTVWARNYAMEGFTFCGDEITSI